MRGRKPHPTRRKELEGNPGKRRLNADEPKPPPLPPDDPIPAEVLAGPAASAEEWRRLAPLLRRLRLVTEADRAALLALCLEWGRYLEAASKVAAMGMIVKAPSGYPIPNPYLSIASRALGACTKLWAELGLTPSSRSRVSTLPPGAIGDAFSEFDDDAPIGPPH